MRPIRRRRGPRPAGAGQSASSPFRSGIGTVRRRIRARSQPTGIRVLEFQRDSPPRPHQQVASRPAACDLLAPNQQGSPDSYEAEATQLETVESGFLRERSRTDPVHALGIGGLHPCGLSGHGPPQLLRIVCEIGGKRAEEHPRIHEAAARRMPKPRLIFCALLAPVRTGLPCVAPHEMKEKLLVFHDSADPVGRHPEIGGKGRVGCQPSFHGNSSFRTAARPHRLRNVARSVSYRSVHARPVIEKTPDSDWFSIDFDVSRHFQRRLLKGSKCANSVKRRVWEPTHHPRTGNARLNTKKPRTASRHTG